MKKLVFIIAILLLSVVQCVASEKTIVAASDPWPPFVDPTSPTEGLTLELVRAAYKTQGYSVKMEYVPWARAEDGVKKGKYDILANTWVTEKRKTYLMYSNPYVYNEIKFIKTKDDPFEFDGMESLTDKRIGIVRGYGYGDAFMGATHFKREEVRDFMMNIKKLTHKDKRVDLTLEDEIVARFNISREAPDLMNKISFTKNALSKKGLHVTAGFANPRHKELINAFNKGLETIKANGELDQILEAYGIK